MSQDNRARTKNSSQVPRSRAPPRGSTGSASQRDKQPNSQDQGEAEIPSEAVTSSTSRPQKTSSPQQEGRRQSNVQFAPAPSLAPSDSISRIKPRSTWPGPNSNSHRKGIRNSRTPWKSYGSQVTRSSSQNGTAWSGSGAALTENNLEKLNEATAKGQSDGYSNQEPRSDQQEAPQSVRRSARQDRNAANGDVARTSGPQQRTQRSSQHYSTAQDNGAPYEDTTKGGGVQTNGSQQSKQQSQAKSPTSPTQAELPNGWERKVRTITKRWPNGREVTEKEVTVQPVGAG